MSVIDMIKTSLKYDEDMLRKITKLRVNSQEQTLTLKIENGKKYYSSWSNIKSVKTK